jgi:membrane-bound lytic murein transglycosylase D
MANIVANPEKYGVTLLPIPDTAYFTRVDTGSQIDLEVVARLTDMPVTELQRINPHLNRWATAPEGPHHLLVPIEKRDVLLAGLSTLPAGERVQWRGHQVRSGDTLHRIARQHGVAAETIRAANNMRSNTLRVGQNLMIPVSARTLPPIITASTKKSRRMVSTAWNGPEGKLQVIHRVRSGETLWSISRRYGVLVSQIVQWNFMRSGQVLKQGQKLRIYPSGKPAAVLADETPNG